MSTRPKTGADLVAQWRERWGAMIDATADDQPMPSAPGVLQRIEMAREIDELLADDRAICLAIIEAARKACHDSGSIQSAIELRKVATKIRNDKRPD